VATALNQLCIFQQMADIGLCFIVRTDMVMLSMVLFCLITFLQAAFEGNPFKTVPGPFKVFWQCMRSKPGYPLLLMILFLMLLVVSCIITDDNLKYVFALST
jgi:hypothetical protein